jgi:hypothetical protein
MPEGRSSGSGLDPRRLEKSKASSASSCVKSGSSGRLRVDANGSVCIGRLEIVRGD